MDSINRPYFKSLKTKCSNNSDRLSKLAANIDLSGFFTKSPLLPTITTELTAPTAPTAPTTPIKSSNKKNLHEIVSESGSSKIYYYDPYKKNIKYMTILVKKNI